MEIELRNERFSDYPETENVVREAFWNRYSPGCCEHYLIHIMRYSRAFVPQLDFVAVFDDKIVGNIVFLKSVIQADTGKEYEVLSLGPISVLPEYQNMGIGQGALPPGEGVIDAPIGRRGDSIIGRCVTPEGKPSRTEYTIIKEENGLSLAACVPVTGRTQIGRAHV